MKTAPFFTLIVFLMTLFMPLSSQAAPQKVVQKSKKRVEKERLRQRPERVDKFQIIYDSTSVAKPVEGTVGLVLSGGGARGLYHIGVIKALEQNDIPIDYISGTSMGAIVGALYAAGYTVEEMTELVTSGQVEQWALGKIDDKYKYYYQERPDSPTMLQIYANTRRDSTTMVNSVVELALPQSVVNTAQIDMALNELFSQASTACGGDFDKLMVPYRCMATDVNEHKAIEFNSGDLAFAVRASMAYPLVFRSVVDKKGRVLIDGGCYNNFPWQPLVEQFNPDYMIGSQCVASNERISASSPVQKQVMALVTQPTDYNLPKENSLMIKREVESGLFDFGAGEETIEQGYTDMLKAIPELKKRLASRRSEESMAERREKFRSSWPEQKFGKVEMEGLRKRQKEYARTFVQINDETDAGRRLNFTTQQVKDIYYQLMASNEFTSTGFPEVKYDSLNQDFVLKLKLASKPSLKFLLGGNVSSSAFNQVFLGMNYTRLSRTAQNVSADIFLGPVSSVIRLGGRSVFLGQTPMYFDYSWQGSWVSTLRGTFGNVTPTFNAIEARTIETYAHLGYGISLTRKMIFELAANTGYSFYAYEAPFDKAGSPHNHDRFRYLSGRLGFFRSTLDKVTYPTRGTRLALSAIGVYGRDRYENAELFAQEDYAYENRSWVGAKLQWEHYPGDWKRSWFSVGYNIEAVYTNHPTFGNEVATILSSPRYAPISHSKMVYMPEFFANRYAALGVMPTFKLLPNYYLRGGVYAMLRDPYGEYNYLHYMADLSFVYHSPVGPLSLSVTKYNFESRNSLYIMFNFGQPIFGGKGLFY